MGFLNGAVFAGLFAAVLSAQAQEIHIPLEVQLTEAEAHELLLAQGSLGAMDVTLEAIIHSGARALAWVDQLQANVPVAEREQIWRRIDRVGHEASPSAPMIYNPGIISSLYEEARAELLPGLADILEGSGDLPPALPRGIALSDAMPAIRKVHTAYSRASRWIMLSQWRSQLAKGARDFRPWLRLNAEKDALLGLARTWPDVSTVARENLANLAISSCPIGGQSETKCRRDARRIIRSDNADNAVRWLEGVFARGQSAYDEKFNVPSPHSGTSVTREGDVLKLKFFTQNIPAQILQWIADEVALAWNNATLQVEVSADALPWPGFGNVRVLWEAGALPHVNGIGGSEITMDANTPLWLEHTRIVMQHEFGHVMAFPDCYTEFWDDENEAFMFYTLDPADRMCALSGETVPRHGAELTRAYSN
jgi:hypothetical protein